jgi:disulfide bond formation protein DsbB
MKNNRIALGGIVFASLLAVAAAWTGEYVFGIVGCTMCVYERVPYFVTAVLAAYALLDRLAPVAQRRVFAVCGIVFAFSAALAIYHGGLQQHWWADFGVCEGALPTESTVENLRAALRNPTPRPPCDEVDWSMFGLSLASLNLIYSTVLVFACAVFALRLRTAAVSDHSRGD